MSVPDISTCLASVFNWPSSSCKCFILSSSLLHVISPIHIFMVVRIYQTTLDFFLSKEHFFHLEILYIQNFKSNDIGYSAFPFIHEIQYSEFIPIVSKKDAASINVTTRTKLAFLLCIINNSRYRPLEVFVI